jgi:single-strand DNA-binding protein
MGTINKVILLGNLGKDPEARSFENGGTAVSFSLATTENYYDREKGERVDLPTEWHHIRVTKPGLTTLAQKLQKGSQVYLEGSLRTRQYQTKEGETKYITEIHVTELVITGNKSHHLPSPANGVAANASVEDNSAF